MVEGKTTTDRVELGFVGRLEAVEFVEVPARHERLAPPTRSHQFGSLSTRRQAKAWTV